jgi:hypothetical protein
MSIAWPTLAAVVCAGWLRELLRRAESAAPGWHIELLDMRAGPGTALARVVRVFGEARPHHNYLFPNRRATRLKVLGHDGFRFSLSAAHCQSRRPLLASNFLRLR